MSFKCYLKQFAITAVIIVVIAITVFSASPTTMKYQGRLTDASGFSVDSFFDITYRLYSDSIGGVILWEETHGVTVVGGLFSVTLGEFTPLDLSSFPVRSDSLFLEVQVGSDLPISPRSRLYSVPISAVSTSVDGDLKTSPGRVVLDARSSGAVPDSEVVIVNEVRAVEHRGHVTVLKISNSGSDTTGLVGIFGDPDFSRVEVGDNNAIDSSIVVTSAVDRGRHKGHVTVLKISNSGSDTTGLVGIFGDPDFSRVEVGDNNAIDSGIVVTSAVDRGRHKGHVTVLKISNSGSDTTDIVGLYGDSEKARLYLDGPAVLSPVSNPDSAGTEIAMRAFGRESSIVVTTEGVGIVFIDSTRDTTFSVQADSGGTVSRMNKADLINNISSDIIDSAGDGGVSQRQARTGRNPQTGATIQIKSSVVLNDTTGGNLSLRYLDVDSDDDGLFDVVVDSVGTMLSLSKADAKRALEGFVSSTEVGLTLIDSTLNDSGLIDLRIDNKGNSGMTLRGAKKVAKFKAGASLASAVNFLPRGSAAANSSKEGAYLGVTGELDRYIEITVDSVSSSLVFGDTLRDTTVVLESAGNSGRVRVISNNSAMGFANSRVEIADLDSDGLVDLQVDGDLRLGGAVGTNILTVVQGSLTDPIADAWTTYSSRRWKENIRTIDNAIEKLQKLRGVEYDWKSNGKHDIGLIAEEVGSVIPEVVVYEENGIDAKSVDYPRLVALLIEASKEQQTNITAMQKEIAELKALVTKLAKHNSSNGNATYGIK